jgi:hypothetical protein
MVYRSDPEHHAKWLASKIADARDRLKDFPLTKIVVSNFDRLTNVDRPTNIFFNLCLDNRHELVEFEQFLTDFKVLSWPNGKLSPLKGRASQNNWESVSVLSEGLAARHYASKIGIEKVEPGPALPTGRFADLSAFLVDRKVFFEMTSLGSGLFEQSLEKAFDIVCKQLMTQLRNKRFVDIVIDVPKLHLDPEKFLDPEEAAAAILWSIENLGLQTLFNSSISPLLVSIGRLAQLPEKEKTVYEHSVWRLPPAFGINLLQEYDRDFAALMSQEPILGWSKTTTPRMLVGSPIDYFSASDIDTFGVEMKTRMVHPSLSSEFEKQSFLAHIRRVISNKLTHLQLQRGSPNVLAVMAHNWLSHGYEDSDERQALSYDLMEKTVRQSLDSFRNEDLSCVMLFEWNYAKAKKILNPYASEASRLSDNEIQTL